MTQMRSTKFFEAPLFLKVVLVVSQSQYEWGNTDGAPRFEENMVKYPRFQHKIWK